MQTFFEKNSFFFHILFKRRFWDVVFGFFIPNNKYNFAVSMLEAGEYDQAISAFMELEGFRDSNDKLCEARYFRATEYMNNGNYSAAQDIFAKLGDYKDSADLLYACEYHIVCRWYDADGTLLLENRIKDGEKPIDNPLPKDSDKWDYIKWNKSETSSDNISFTASGSFVLMLK